MRRLCAKVDVQAGQGAKVELQECRSGVFTSCCDDVHLENRTEEGKLEERVSRSVKYSVNIMNAHQLIAKLGSYGVLMHE